MKSLRNMEFTDWLGQFGDKFPTTVTEDDIKELQAMVKKVPGIWVENTLPSMYCDQLGISKGSTYTQAARAILKYHKHKVAN